MNIIDNEYDERTIAIKNENGDKLGYIPRDKNEILSRLMDAGKLLYGEVWTFSGIDIFTMLDNPVYEGVIDNEEFTSYLYPTDSDLWEILEDPTGMAYRTIYELCERGQHNI